MPKKVASAILFVLMPMIAFASPGKGNESIRVEVVKVQTKVHGKSPNVYAYTDVIFARVDGKNLIFVCEQRGDECPLMENGKTYDAMRNGDSVYIVMSTLDSKKPIPVKFRQGGAW